MEEFGKGQAIVCNHLCRNCNRRGSEYPHVVANAEVAAQDYYARLSVKQEFFLAAREDVQRFEVRQMFLHET